MAPSPRPGAAVVALVIACVALALAAWPYLRPERSMSYPEADVQRAEARLCAAHDLASTSVGIQTNAEPPSDPAGVLATAANARLALVVASADLTAAADESPAAPPELTSAVRDLADRYRVVASNYLAGADNNTPSVAEALRAAAAAATTIDSSCGR